MYATATDEIMAFVQVLMERRVPKTTVKPANYVREFIKGRNDDLGNHPADDLVIGAHANSEGQWYVPLFPGQVDAANKATTRTDFEHIEQTMGADGVTRRIRVDDSLIGWTGPPPTHHVRLLGCNLGKATPFLTKLKEALGGHVLVTVPKHFYGVATIGKTKGSIEYMCYEFSVQTPAVPRQKGGFDGFATRAALLTALDNAGHRYIGPTAAGAPVPTADWDTKWVPNDISKSQSFFIPMTLGRTIVGLKAIVMKPDTKKNRKGAREFRVNVIPTIWPFTPPDTATTDAARVAALKARIAQDPRFATGHPWAKFKRAGYNSLDDYMAGHHWDFGDDNKGPMTTGRRVEYTVVFPITDSAGHLVYNFYPAPGTTDAAITTGFSTIGLDRFFATV